MIYNIFPPHKTLALALSLVGGFGVVACRAQAQSLSLSKHSLSGQAVANSLWFNSNIASSHEHSGDRGRPPGSGVGAASYLWPGPQPGAAAREMQDRGRTGGRREGAATRGRCPMVQTPLMALVPVVEEMGTQEQRADATNSSSNIVFGLTTAERPRFWFYVPYTLDATKPAEFVLQDAQGNDVYQTMLTASSDSPGIVSFELPATAPALELNKMYHWYLLIYCNPEEPVFVEGWVQRTALNPSVSTQLEQATPEQKVTLYGEAGIWHEALTTLAKVHQQNPNNPTVGAQWVELLQSIGLEALASEPITSELTPQE